MCIGIGKQSARSDGQTGRLCNRRLVFSSWVGLALWMGMWATAAQADATGTEQPSSPESQQETMQPASNEAVQLEAITVTGGKTPSTRTNTPDSVTALTEEDIKELPGATTFNDVVRLMPNVIDSGSGNLAPSIRGINSTGPASGNIAFYGGTRPQVTIQIDGRPLTFNELVFGTTGLWDVKQVEVFRGPQTTQQGPNSIAGAISIDTKDPTFEYHGGGQLIFGNYDSRQYSGFVSGPIVDNQLAFRLSVDRQVSESWVEFEGTPYVKDAKQKEATSLRAKLLYLPLALPNLSAKLTLTHTDTRRPQTELVRPNYEDRVMDYFPGVFPVYDNKSNGAILDL